MLEKPRLAPLRKLTSHSLKRIGRAVSYLYGKAALTSVGLAIIRFSDIGKNRRRPDDAEGCSMAGGSIGKVSRVSGIATVDLIKTGRKRAGSPGRLGAGSERNSGGKHQP